MATTKKVATSTKGVKQVKPALKSTPKKKTVRSEVKKQVIKTKTVSSKAGKLPIKNNTVKKVEGKKNIDSKLEKVEAFQMKAKNVAPVPKQKSEPSRFLKLRPKLELALLSPYRFPVDTEKIAVGAARYGGIFFVAIGAIFTLFFASHSFTTGAVQTAQLTQSITPSGLLQPIVCSTSGSGSGTCPEGSNSGPSNTTTTVNQKPMVAFEVNNPQALSGSVQVRVKVPNATSVKLMAFYKTQNQELMLGRPVRVSGDTWEMYWNTDTFDEGEYKLKALIENQYGAYEAVDSKFVQVVRPSTIANTVTALADSVADTDEDDSTDEEEEVTETTSSSAPVLTLDKRSDSEFRFEISIDDADKVKLYIRHPGATERKLLNYAFKANDDLWKYRWIPMDLPIGEYAITAVAVIDDQQFESNSIVAKIGEKPSPTTAIAPVIDMASSVVSSSTDTTKVLAPDIVITAQAPSPLSKIVPILIDVKNALGVEVFVLPRNSLIQKYLGSARIVDQDTWNYRWDTTTIPNGEYKLFAYVKNTYGTYTKEGQFLKVQNDVAVTYTEEQQQKVQVLSDIGTQEVASVLPQPVRIAPAPTTASTPVPQQITNASGTAPAGTPVPSEVKPGAQTVPTPEQTDESFNRLLESYRVELDAELQRLATALRLKDERTIQDVKFRLETLKKKIKNSDIAQSDSVRLIDKIDSFLSEAVRNVEQNVERVEKVLTERTEEKAVLDSDKDGISDFDEVNIYTTNPFGADSDNDGFTDGAEILSGFNPVNGESEAAIVYESPKETGIVREDILEVTSIVTAQPNEGQEETTPSAIISGKALPNSFVTLYIFSTPIVVTLKTDADGSWNYRFDKELEDGEHQVYIGVTDNAGKIVAKSNPLTFVKEAQAFTAANTVNGAPVEAPRQSFISEYMVYLVLSISVVAIGLVLILLGLHLDSRQRKIAIVNEETTVTV